MEHQKENQEFDNTEHVEIIVGTANSDRNSDHQHQMPKLDKSPLQTIHNEKTIPPSEHKLSFAQPLPTKPSPFYLQENTTADSSTARLSSTSSLSRSSLPITQPHDSSFDPSSITLEQKRDMLISLGKALLRYGTPSYNVESGLKLTAAKLNFKMTFTFTPESLMLTAVRKPSTTTASTHTSAEGKRLHKHRRHRRSSNQRVMNKRKRSDHSTMPKTELSSAMNIVDQQPSNDTTKTDKHQPWIILLKIRFAFDNAKLDQISRLMHRFYTDDPALTFETCLSQLKYDIIASPATWGPWTRIFASTITAFAASIIMFNGSWIDSGFSALLGMVVGALKELANLMPVYARVFEVSTCTIISVAVRSLHNYCCYNATILSSIIILLPGYAMTMAVMEITSKHMVSGAIRLIHVIFYSFLLAYGLELGSYLYAAIHPGVSNQGYCPVSPHLPAVPPKWAILPLFPIMTSGLGIVFGSAPRQWPSEIISATLGFGATYFLQRVIPDPPILNAISAFLVGLYSHIALKVTGQAPISPISVGVSMLVPGSIGVKGAFNLLHQREEGKSNFALQMLNIAIGLSVGLFASGMVVYPAGKRRSLYISL